MQQTKPADRPRHIPKGHDAILKTMQDSKKDIVISLISGDTYVGPVTGRDKFTISQDGRNLDITRDNKRVKRVFYKHAIEFFCYAE